MNILKSASKTGDIPDRPNTKRRSFMWKIGAAVPAVLAAAVTGRSNSEMDQDAGLKKQMDRLSGRLGILEDENAIRGLHRTYENLLHDGRYEEVVNLFTDDGEVIFNGGIFIGKSRGIRRLYSERFKPGYTGRRIEPAPGFQPDAELQQEMIKIASDRKSAGARFSYSIQVGAPMIPDSQLVQMARLHGEGIMKWWEGGIYEAAYIKDIAAAGWKIKRLDYRVLSTADYRPGKIRARPISVPRFSRVYPEDPAGPDRLADNDPKRMMSPVDC